MRIKELFKESASVGATSSANIASNVATGDYGNGFLNGGPGATTPKTKKKKKPTKVIKR